MTSFANQSNATFMRSMKHLSRLRVTGINFIFFQNCIHYGNNTELKNLLQQYISNPSRCSQLSLTGACNLSNTLDIIPENQNWSRAVELPYSTSISFLLANTRIPRFHKTRFLFERTRELASYRVARRVGTKKTLSSSKLAGLAASERNGSPSRCDSTQPSWKSFSCVLFFFYPFLRATTTDFLYPVGGIRIPWCTSRQAFGI